MKNVAESIPDDKRVIDLTVGELKAVLATPVAPSLSKYIDEPALFAEFGLKKASADARGIPRVRIGRKSRWLRSDVEASIATAAPRPLKKRELPAENVDPLEQMVARGELRRVGGGR